MEQSAEILILSEVQFKRVRTQWLHLKRQREAVRQRSDSVSFRSADAALRALESSISAHQAAMDKYVASLQGPRKIPQLESIQSVGELLVQARLALNLTQGGLAQLADMHRQQIHRYEQNRYKHATLQTLQRIAAVLLDVDQKKRDQLDPGLFTPAERVRMNTF